MYTPSFTLRFVLRSVVADEDGEDEGTPVKARTSGRGKNDEDANAENGPKVIVVEDEEEPAKKGCCVVM